MGLAQPSLEKRRRTLFVAILLAAAAAVFLGLSGRSGEPSYKGHRLSSWVKVTGANNAQNFGPDCTAREAPDAIRSMGTNCLPYLVEWLRYNGGPTPVRDAVNKGIEKCPWLGKINRLRDWARCDTGLVRADGTVQAFEFLRATGSPAIPSLAIIATTGNPKTQDRATCALEHIGPPALNALASIVTNLVAHSAVRSRAALHLGYSGARAEFAIPNLLIALEDPDDSVAISAAGALGRLKSQAARVVPALTTVAARPSLARAVAALNALENRGPQARDAISALWEIGRSDNRTLRYYAACAIATIENRRVRDLIAEVEQRYVVNAPIQ